MAATPFIRIADAEAEKARARYQADMQRRKRDLANLDGAALLGRAISSAQICDALQAHIEGLETFIRHARLAGKDAARVLRDDALRLLFVDEARRRLGL